MLLLLLAWTLGYVCRELGTGDVVASLLGPWVPAGLLPVAVFATGAVVSFASGTSWGTFAILLPLAASLASTPEQAPLLVGAVLSGGVFGDHTSPISDTTLLASVASGVEHAEHVRSQLPYALVVGALCAVGFVVAGGLGGSMGIGAGLGLGLVGCALAVGVSRR
jgi:Na+/H+ antiporter NhaC